MIRHHRELSLEEMLSDSVVQAVMEADGVDPVALEIMLKEAGRNVSLALRARPMRPPSTSPHQGIN